MSTERKLGPQAVSIALLVALLWCLPTDGARAVAADFDSIRFEVVGPRLPTAWSESLEILADGTCTFGAEGSWRFTPGTTPWPAKTYTHTLSETRMARLRSLLVDTDWLRTPLGKQTSWSTDDRTMTITLRAGEETRKVIWTGRPPPLYEGLFWFRRTLCVQERMLYELQCGDRAARVQLCGDLAGYIPGLRGEPNRALPPFELDYRRYVDEMRRILDKPEENRDGNGFLLMAAIEVLSQAGDEAYYERIAGFVADENLQVSRTAADALAYLRRPELIPYLVADMESGVSTEYAATALVRMGDVAVPAIAEVLASNGSGLAPRVVRVYIRQWDLLAAPLDPRIPVALQAGIRKRGDPFTRYYGYLIDLARLRPITAEPVLGIAYYDEVVRREPSTLLHGWYVCKDGKIVAHAAAPKTDTSAARLLLAPAKPQIVGDQLRFSASWRVWRYPEEGLSKPVQETYSVPVPANSVFEMGYESHRGKMTAVGDVIEGGLRLTPQYHILWQGRVVSEGKEVLTVTYIARLAPPTDPAQEFVSPEQPLPLPAEPPPFDRSRYRE